MTCGTALTYEAATFVPDVRESVPIRRHGYCPVVSRDDVDGRRIRGSGRTVTHRSQRELLDFLSRRPVTPVHGLMRNRFTRDIASERVTGIEPA
jgi:hypothetical protein